MRRLPLLLAWSTLGACTPAATVDMAECEGVPAMELRGRIDDRAGLVPADGERRIDAALASYEAQTGRQLVIASVGTQNGRALEDYAQCLGNRWRIGGAERDDGVLILLVEGERRMRIAAGHGAEALLTNAEAATIVQTMTPRFADGQFTAGLLLGIDAIKAEMGKAS